MYRCSDVHTCTRTTAQELSCLETELSVSREQLSASLQALNEALDAKAAYETKLNEALQHTARCEQELQQALSCHGDCESRLNDTLREKAELEQRVVQGVQRLVEGSDAGADALRDEGVLTHAGGTLEIDAEEMVRARGAAAGSSPADDVKVRLQMPARLRTLPSYDCARAVL
jgi:hypothetical protein